jgi:hypothetical protein
VRTTKVVTVGPSRACHTRESPEHGVARSPPSFPNRPFPSPDCRGFTLFNDERRSKNYDLARRGHTRRAQEREAREDLFFDGSGEGGHPAHSWLDSFAQCHWIPACTGMTNFSLSAFSHFRILAISCPGRAICRLLRFSTAHLRLPTTEALTLFKH